MITLKEIIEYEVHSSWWAKYISNPLLQNLSGKYFAWKARKKYYRYYKSKQINIFIKEHLKK